MLLVYKGSDVKLGAHPHGLGLSPRVVLLQRQPRSTNKRPSSRPRQADNPSVLSKCPLAYPCSRVTRTTASITSHSPGGERGQKRTHDNSRSSLGYHRSTQRTPPENWGILAGTLGTSFRFDDIPGGCSPIGRPASCRPCSTWSFSRRRRPAKAVSWRLDVGPRTRRTTDHFH